MTSKQRAYLKSLAQTMEPIFQIGKNSLTPENTKAIAETTCAVDIDIQKKDAVKSCRRYKYAVKLKEEDDPKLIRDMNTVLNGRGGGKGGFAQGSVSASEQDIRAFFERLG